MKKIKDKLAIREYESPEEYRKRLRRMASKNVLLQDGVYVRRLLKVAEYARQKRKGRRILAARARQFKPEYEKLYAEMRDLRRVLTNQRYYCARNGEQDGVDFCNAYLGLLRQAKAIMKTQHAEGLIPKHWSEVLDRNALVKLRSMREDMVESLAKRFWRVAEETFNPKNYKFEYRKYDPRVDQIAAFRRTGKPNDVPQPIPTCVTLTQTATTPPETGVDFDEEEGE
jgi:hypothetical protein